MFFATWGKKVSGFLLCLPLGLLTNLDGGRPCGAFLVLVSVHLFVSCWQAGAQSQIVPLVPPKQSPLLRLLLAARPARPSSGTSRGRGFDLRLDRLAVLDLLRDD